MKTYKLGDMYIVPANITTLSVSGRGDGILGGHIGLLINGHYIKIEECNGEEAARKAVEKSQKIIGEIVEIIESE